MSLKGDEPVPPANARDARSFYTDANPGKWKPADWKGLPKEEQEPFKQMAKKDRKRYQTEAIAYHKAKHFRGHLEELEDQPITSNELELPCYVDIRKLRLMEKEDLTDKYIDGATTKTIRAINSTRCITTSGKVKDALKNYVAGEEYTKGRAFMSDGSILHQVLELAKDSKSRVNLFPEVPWPGAEGGTMPGLVFNKHPKGDDGEPVPGASASEEVGAKILGKSPGFDHGKGVTNSSRIIVILVTECGLLRHPNNTGEYDILAFGHPKLPMGGVAKNVFSLHEDGKTIRSQQNKAAKTAAKKAAKKTGAAGGGKKASEVDNHATSLMAEEMESEDAAEDDERAAPRLSRAKKKDDAMPEEGSKPSAKENESSGGKKRKGTGGGEKKKKKKDPNAPKNPRSAYTFFMMTMRPILKNGNPEADASDISKMISEQWKVLADQSKYVRQAEDDKVRYNNEMKDYTPLPEEDDDASPVEEDDAPKEDGPPVKRPRREIASYGPVEAAGGGGGKKSSTKMPSKWNDEEEEEEEESSFSTSDLKLGKVVTFDDAEYDEQLARVYTEPSSKDKQVELQLIDEEGKVVEEVEEGDSIVHVDIAHITGVEEDPDSDSDSEQEVVELNEYEQMRAQRVARNAERLRSLGLA